VSGIVGIVNLNGAPVDRRMLRCMTDFMTYRGPDAQEIWSNGQIGFGHTMLRTTWESDRERQPCSLDGKVWITADARVDGRGDLIAELEPYGRRDLRAATDVELILHAYHVWGEDCVNHLLGDFAFAIWDGPGRRLFCARDHFGVKPFYYAPVGNSLLFSNTLNCLRSHPAVSDHLNDQAIADFLLFESNQEPCTTMFADIQRLPPAHFLTCLPASSLRLKGYWMLPPDGQIRYKRSSDYVDHFRELFTRAVNDRLRTNRVAVYMSGGLDSTSIAATAKQLTQQSPSFELHADTVVYDGLMPDRERYYSGLVAKHLRIPIHYLVADDYSLFESRERPGTQPEPDTNPLATISADLNARISSRSRVVLSGLGGDAAFNPSGEALPALLRERQYGILGKSFLHLVLSHRRFPRVGIRSLVKRWSGAEPGKPQYPSWVNHDFAERLGLTERWQRFTKDVIPDHPRPEAYASLRDPLWAARFENQDVGTILTPLETRYPFFDIRLIHYVLALPPIPWFVEKNILRQATKGILPERVRLRPKTPLVSDPIEVGLEQLEFHLGILTASSSISDYVDCTALSAIPSKKNTYILSLTLRPIALNRWLLCPRPTPIQV